MVAGCKSPRGKVIKQDVALARENANPNMGWDVPAPSRGSRKGKI